MSDTMTALLELIRKAFDIDPATIDPARPFAEYGLDSLSKAELLFAIEDHFHISYPEEHADVPTLEALADVVSRLRAPAQA